MCAFACALLGCYDLNKSGFQDAGVDAAPTWSDGEIEWAVRAGGPGGDRAFGVSKVASGGDLIVVGQFEETATFDPAGTHETQLTATDPQLPSDQCGHDIFFARYGPGGDLNTWVKQAGGSGCDVANDVLALNDGTILTAGSFRYDDAVFGSGEEHETTLVSNQMSIDAFSARLSQDGELGWAKSAGSPTTDQALAVGVSTFVDAPYLVSGEFRSTAVFGFEEVNETELQVGPGCVGMFVAAYATNGDLGYAIQSFGDAAGADLGVTGDGESFVVTGWFAGETSFEPDGEILDNEGDTDIFLAKYDAADGGLIWAVGAGSSQDDKGMALTVLGDDSSIVGGTFTGTAVFGKGGGNETTLSTIEADPDGDAFLARYHPDGTLAWAKQIGGTGSDTIEDLALTPNGDNLLVVGEFKQELVLGQGEERETTLLSAGECDIFIARYDLDGSLVWARREGGELDDHGLAAVALTDDSAVVAGWFCGTATFGPGEEHETTLSAETDLHDVLLMRLSID
jgi:hypothetical protein